MERGIGYQNLVVQAMERPYQEEYLDCPPESWEDLMPEDALVQTEIVERNGLYIVYLIFVDVEDARQFVRVPAKVCRTRRSAEVVASYKCRFCACDKCLPFQVDLDDFQLCDN